MKIAFVFPGQGSQQVGMMRELYDRFASVRERFSEADEALGLNLTQLIFDGPAEELVKTEFTQPAILTASVAAADLLMKEGIVPSLVAGHSLGEYSSLVCAGALSFADAVRTVRLRGKFMQEAVPLGEGAMAAVIRLDRDVIDRICRDVSETGYIVEAVNFNCPGQVVIAGSIDGVRIAGEKMKEAGAGRVLVLNVSAPFHSSLMAPAAKRLEKALNEIEVRDAQIPVVANVDAQVVQCAEDIKRLLVLQADHPVLWEDLVHTMMDLDVDTMVEVGPGKVLCGFMKKIDRNMHVENVEDFASLEKSVLYLKGDAHE